jgi:ferric-dicitrate binding protein FerR (iron transport regulator)
MNRPLEPLLKELAEAHRGSLRGDALTVEIERRLALRAPSRRSGRGIALFAALGAVAAGVLVARPLRAPAPSAPLTLAFSLEDSPRAGRVGDELTAAGDAAREAQFSDGSRVRLEAGARARVDALDADGASLTLNEGRLDARIVHRPRTRWQVRAGAYAIHVVGTRFAAAWTPGAHALTVRLFEGAVEVTGPGLPATRVSAGQTLEIASTGSRLVRDDVGPRSAAFVNGARGPEPAASPSAPPPRERPQGDPPRQESAHGGDPERWRDLAAHGRYRAALGAARGPAGDGFSARCQRLDGAEVIWLGDVARLAGDAARATEAYQSALHRFPALDRPAFALGVLAFDVQHDYARAGDWFARYLAEHPRGPLAAEAAGRLLESFQRAGDERRATEAATSYLRAYPTGAQASLARRVLAR